MTDTTVQPWTDAEVDRYALVIAAAGGDDQWINGVKRATDIDPEALMEDYRPGRRTRPRRMRSLTCWSPLGRHEAHAFNHQTDRR